jgi:cytoskeletal protein RodZ
MASGIGETLRVTRRQQRLTLAEAAAEIRVREPYLAALEEEKFSKLGGDVYVRAFLRGYSEFLGLDPDQIVEAYRREYERGARAEADQQPVVEVPPVTPAVSAWDETSALEPAPPPSGGLSRGEGDDDEDDLPRGSFFPRAVTIAGVILLMLVVTAVALRGRGPDTVAADQGAVASDEPVVIPTVEASPVLETPSPPPATEPTVQPAPAPSPAPTPAPPTPQGPLEDINVQLTVTDGPAWLRAEVDGSVTQVGIAEPGTTFTWEAEESLVLRIGDASNVRLVLNGVDQGVLGGERELRDIEYRIGQTA